MTEDRDSSARTKADQRRFELEMMLEAARRANWDAMHGPRHLRTGRFNPTCDEDVVARDDAGAASGGKIDTPVSADDPLAPPSTDPRPGHQRAAAPDPEQSR